MPKRLTLVEISTRVRSQWDGVATLDETTFVDQKTPARFFDCDYGEWWAKPFHVMKGNGRHPKRARANTVKARKCTVDDVVRRVFERHNGRIELRAETYVNIHTRATFVDREYGEWQVAPYSVLSGRGHPLGKLQKAIATMRSFAPVVHWKTGELCHSASGFEHAVLIWLNINLYDFAWQVPICTEMLSPKRHQPVIYNVDLYIKSGPFVNTYVEVKGTWSRRVGNDGGRAKWEWFHATYPNSQLWMRCDLKRLGIIDAKRAYLDSART
jgi:hypothetical protein